MSVWNSSVKKISLVKKHGCGHGMQVVFGIYNGQEVLQKNRLIEISRNTVELFKFNESRYIMLFLFQQNQQIKQNRSRPAHTS